MTVAPQTLASSAGTVQLPEIDQSVRPDLDALDFAPHSASSATTGPSIPEMPEDLSSVSTRELRILSNQLYRVMDTDFPPFGLQDHYHAVVEVLDAREVDAAGASQSEKLREKFRDNHAGSRFELFHDGSIVGYVKYDLRAGRIRLLETVVGPAHQRAGLEPVLVRQALLNIHRRRLVPIPYCKHAQQFLANNPQFEALIPSS